MKTPEEKVSLLPVTVTVKRNALRLSKPRAPTLKLPALRVLENFADEFAYFASHDIRLERVTLHKTNRVPKLLEYYMGKNTAERQVFIIRNLVVERPAGENPQ